MSRSMAGTPQPVPSLMPPGIDLLALLAIALGMVVLYVPTSWSLAHTIWASDEQGHGPIIMAVSYWLLYRQRHALAQLPDRPSPRLAWALLALALLGYVFGRSQGVLMAEVGSQIPLLAGLMLLFKGPAALRRAWFPLVFLIFMIPLPGALVAWVTTPLKAAVSYSAEMVLYQVGYPVARTGVMLSVGPYQLLVADACAGLNSMFTLEALGLLYMNLRGYSSWLRNALLATLVIPISFIANVIRVMILVLVTYHFGDAAGQGFIHGFAGLVLFMVGLAIMLAVDRLLGFAFASAPKAAA
jgi:exosortase B